MELHRSQNLRTKSRDRLSNAVGFAMLFILLIPVGMLMMPGGRLYTWSPNLPKFIVPMLDTIRNQLVVALFVGVVVFLFVLWFSFRIGSPLLMPLIGFFHEGQHALIAWLFRLSFSMHRSDTYVSNATKPQWILFAVAPAIGASVVFIALVLFDGALASAAFIILFGLCAGDIVDIILVLRTPGNLVSDTEQGLYVSRESTTGSRVWQDAV